MASKGSKGRVVLSTGAWPAVDEMKASRLIASSSQSRPGTAESGGQTLPSVWSKYDVEVRSSKRTGGPKLALRTMPEDFKALPPGEEATAVGGLLTSRTRYDRIAQTLQTLPGVQDDTSTISTVVRAENERQLLRRLHQPLDATEGALVSGPARLDTGDAQQRHIIKKIVAQIKAITSERRLALHVCHVCTCVDCRRRHFVAPDSPASRA